MLRKWYYIITLEIGGYKNASTKNGCKWFDTIQKKVDIDFFAEQRVSSDNNEMVSPCFGSVYTNNVMSIVGINASGKTSLLKVISFVIEFINGESINNINNRDILKDAEKVQIIAYFFDPKNGVSWNQKLSGLKTMKLTVDISLIMNACGLRKYPR